MNAKKIIIGAVVLAAGAILSAQTVSFHGYLDYTNFAVGQENRNLKDSSTEWTKASAEFGSFYNGRTELNMNVTAANFVFNVGIRLDASGNSWYNLYHDVTQVEKTFDKDNNEKIDYVPTPFHQMNLRVSFFNDQIFLYTGRFEEWNAGYIFNGYALGGQNIRNLADRDNGQHLTAIEFCPQFISGLKVFAGVPILPVSGNGVNYWSGNQWENLYKKVKLAAQYKTPTGITFNGGWRPGTYYSGLYEYDSADGATTNYFGEAYLQADMPYLVPNVPLNASFDLRYRNNDTVGKEVFAYYAGVSGQVKPVSNLTINFEDRVFYADDHYLAVNEKLIYDILGLNAVYTFTGTPYQIGVQLNTMYAQDVNGSAFAEETSRIRNKWTDDFAMSSDWMDSAALPASGSAGRYFTVYGYPYVQKNFANGYARLGIEVQYSRFQTSNTTEGITYRVPVGLCFWF
jgi:hypothetical protein